MESKHRLDELTTAYMIGMRLHRLLSLHDLAQEMINILEDHFDYDDAAILLVDQSHPNLDIFAHGTRKNNNASGEINHSGLDDAVPGYTSVIKNKKSILLGKLGTKKDFFPHRPEIQSVLCVPILSNQDVLGVITVESVEPDHFNPSDLDVLERIAEQFKTALQNARVLEELHARQQQLEALAQQIIFTQEEERRRISRELHDEAGQTLTALRIQLDLVHTDLPQTNAAIDNRFNAITELLETTMDQVRAIAHSLHVPSLETLDFDDFLNGFCESLSRKLGIAIDHQIDHVPDASPLMRISIYRILQEGIDNAIQHGNATRLEVRLENTPSTLLFTLIDNGSGFDSAGLASTKIGTGLSSVQERVMLLHGTFTLRSEIGVGTTLVVKLPTESSQP